MAGDYYGCTTGDYYVFYYPNDDTTRYLYEAYPEMVTPMKVGRWLCRRVCGCLRAWTRLWVRLFLPVWVRVGALGGCTPSATAMLADAHSAFTAIIHPPPPPNVTQYLSHRV